MARPDVAGPVRAAGPATVDLVEALELRPVSTEVNSVKNNNGPELLEREEPKVAD